MVRHVQANDGACAWRTGAYETALIAHATEAEKTSFACMFGGIMRTAPAAPADPCATAREACGVRAGASEAVRAAAQRAAAVADRRLPRGDPVPAVRVRQGAAGAAQRLLARRAAARAARAGGRPGQDGRPPPRPPPRLVGCALQLKAAPCNMKLRQAKRCTGKRGMAGGTHLLLVAGAHCAQKCDCYLRR